MVNNDKKSKRYFSGMMIVSLVAGSVCAFFAGHSFATGYYWLVVVLDLLCAFFNAFMFVINGRRIIKRNNGAIQ